MKKYDILTVLDTCIDLIVSDVGDKIYFDQAEKLVKDYNVALGGSGCIFACQAAKLKLNTVGVGKVGSDSFGGIVINGLKDAGVDTRYISVDKDLKTGITVHLCKSDDRAMLTYSGTIDGVTPDMLTDDLLSQTRHLHIASYYLTDNISPAYSEIVQKAKSYGATVSLDPNYDPDNQWDDVKTLFPYVDILFCNVNELTNLSGEREISRAVQSLDIPLVVVKDGSKGAAVWQKENCLRLPAFVTGKPYVDSIGAGDSFAAGFLYGYLNKMPLEKALTVACVCGAYNVTGAGGTAGQIDLTRLKNLKI